MGIKGNKKERLKIWCLYQNRNKVKKRIGCGTESEIEKLFWLLDYLPILQTTPGNSSNMLRVNLRCIGIVYIITVRFMIYVNKFDFKFKLIC